ncbi:MAG: 5'/3'-nucleotidase SurE [Proteobacteria bacterium]|nr:5'/3'-nucleotidase SurE [Pseudomonadota bacterium]
MSGKNNPNERPLVFLTNDDGIQSPGLHALAAAILPLAEIVIVAPSHQQTAAGRGLTGDKDTRLSSTELKIADHKITAYHNSCSPAVVVMQGIQIFETERKPDLLISGINYGENLGRDITMSGTVGAAVQGACMGIPSLAVSLQTPTEYHYQHAQVDWESASFFARKFARIMLDGTLPMDVDLMKLDIPQNATRETPWRITCLEKQSYFSARIESPSLDSRLSDAKIGVAVDKEILDKNSDIYAILVDEVVSVTPISLDATSRVSLSRLQEHIREPDDV